MLITKYGLNGPFPKVIKTMCELISLKLFKMEIYQSIIKKGNLDLNIVLILFFLISSFKQYLQIQSKILHRKNELLE